MVKGANFNTNTSMGTTKLLFDHPDGDSFKFRVRRLSLQPSSQLFSFNLGTAVWTR